MQVCFTHDNTIKLYQTGFDRFAVVYGLQSQSDLSYAAAATELGRAIMHNAACNGRLDNRSKQEAAVMGDKAPHYSRPVNK
jgi:hypothetical protein